MMFSEQKVPLFHLFTGQVYLESNFGHLSSVQNSPIHKKKENLICTVPTTQQHTNCTHYANHRTALIYFSLGLFCANCLRTSLQHQNNKPEF